MSVNELRLRTTQERLRGDHIDLLGLLQQSTVENAELREELSRLKKLGTVTHVEAEVAVIDTSESDAVIAELRLELNTANTKCKKLDSEKKTVIIYFIVSTFWLESSNLLHIVYHESGLQN